MTSGTLSVLINGQKAKEYIHKNVTYIEGRKNSEYKLRYFNNTNSSVEVIFSVDGLDVLYGKPAGPQTKGYLVQAWSSIDVPGWRINDTKVAAFKFRPQGDSEDKTYVESLKEVGFNVDTSNQGVIGVMVFKEKPKPKIVPLRMNYNSSEQSRGIAPEFIPAATMDWCESDREAYTYGGNIYNMATSASASASLSNDKPLGTGWGTEQSFNTKYVSFVRQNQNTPDFIQTISYDTLSGLKRKGVPVEEVQHVANAFPAYRNDGCYIPKK